MLFTPAELQEILSALRMAEDCYAADAKREAAVATEHRAEGHARLAVQFDRKAQMVHAVADKIAANAGTVGVHGRVLELA